MPILESINSSLGIQLPVHAIIIAILIIVLSLLFIGKYLIPALLLLFRLWRLQKSLKVFKQSNQLGDPTDLFNRGRLLNHLWAEYKETLHEQLNFNPQTGIEELAAIRSTVSANTFFSSNILVDSSLHAEFFKHLPGILTGMGIIGTFLGLIQGLRAFHISENTQVVHQSLNSLLAGVYEAFLVSGIAIGLAMLITFIEKWLLSWLYRQVEELCFLIDSLYESGVGEEYLARLVKASETSASQANIIKDALVDDLKKILSEVTHQQIQSSLSSQQELGEQFKQSIQTGISQPLQRIADGLNQQRESTGRDLSSALDDVLVAFTQRLQDLFGGQTAGIYELHQKTIEALQSTIQQFQQMASNIDATGRQTTGAMAETLTETMKAMESRQQTMNERMAEFLGQVRKMTQESHAETGQKLQTLLGDLGQQMTRMVTELQTQSRAANDDHQGRQQQMADATIAAITNLSNGVQTSLQTMQGQLTGMLDKLEQQTQSTAAHYEEQQRRASEHGQRVVENLTASVDQTVTKVSTQAADLLAQLVILVENHQQAAAEAVRSIHAAVASMNQVTTAALTDLNRGAETVLTAAHEFGRAGQSVAGVFEEATGVAKELSTSAETVSSATRAMGAIVDDHRMVRQQLNEMIEALKSTVASARKEASLTADILTRIDSATQKLATAQNQADLYLSQVAEVLAQTHQEFASSMRNTLSVANQQFFQHLSDATSLLRESIGELEATLSEIGSNPPNRR